jgi:hypothetical protein
VPEEAIEVLKTIVWFAGLLISAVGNYLWTTFRVGQNAQHIKELREWRAQVEEESKAELRRELERIRQERIRNGRGAT